MPSQPPLETQQVEVRLGKADLKTSDKLAVPGTLAVAENVEMNRTGRYQRRSGSAYVDTVTGAVRIHGGERETIVGTIDTLYSHVDGAFAARGSVAGYRAGFDPVNPSAFAQCSHDMAQVGGLDFSAWQEASGAILYAARDSATGAYVVSDGVITSAASRVNPMVLAAGQYVVVLYTTGGTVVARRINTATPAVVGAETVVCNLGLGTGYDAILKSGTTICVAAHTLAVTAFLGLTEFDVATMTAGAARSTNLAFTAAGAAYTCAFLRNATGYVVVSAVSDNGTVGSNIKVVTAPLGLASTALVTIFSGSAGTVHSITNCAGLVDGSGTWHILVDLTLSTASARSQIWYFTRTSGGVVTGPGILFGFRLMSRTFAFGGRDLYVASGTVQSLAGPDSTLFLLVVQTGAVVGRALAGVADERSNDTSGNVRPGLLPHVTVTATDVLVPTVYFITTVQRAACLVDFDIQPVSRYLEIAGVTLIPGSTIYMYDGIGVSELGFHFPPGITAITTAATGGLQTGTYWYRACWEWVDPRGRAHRSKPCDPVSLVVASNNLRGRVTIGTLVTTLKAAPIPQAALALFRSTINPSSSSAAEYRRCATVANDPTTAVLIIDDTMTDATLGAQDRLYTLGNTRFANAAPPPANALAAYGGRAWAVERDLLWFSNPIEDGFGVEFPAENFLQVSDEHGDFITCADAGQRLAAFKRTGIYVVSGEGPSAIGQGSFSPVRRLPAPLGARSAVAVINTELGVFFQDDASGHLWLLPPEGDPEPIGREVESLSMGLTITEAVVVSDKRQVRFFSQEGTTLIYDMTHQQWAWSTQQPALAAALVAGVCSYVTAADAPHGVTAGDIREDDPTTWREGDTGATGVPYAAALELDWLSPNQLAGYARTFAVVATGEKLGDHLVTVTLGYRFGTTEESRVVDASLLSTAFGYQIEARPSIREQQATAIKVRIEDNAPLTAGFGIEVLSLTVGLRGKRARLPKAHAATP